MCHAEKLKSEGGGRADAFQLAQQFGLLLGFGGQEEFVAAGENLLLLLRPQGVADHGVVLVGAEDQAQRGIVARG